MPVTTNLRRASSIAGLVVRLAGDGAPGVRFAILSHTAGVGVVGVAGDVAKAMQLDVATLRASMLTGDEMADGSPARTAHERNLGAMRDALVLVSDCDTAPTRTMRDIIETLALQGTDRDDEPRALLVLLTTRGDIAALRDLVVQATGRSTVAFDIVD